MLAVTVFSPSPFDTSHRVLPLRVRALRSHRALYLATPNWTFAPDPTNGTWSTAMERLVRSFADDEQYICGNAPIGDLTKELCVRDVALFLDRERRTVA